jgi:23S rRNA pseudouridine1911/1915/1917 synthase
LKLEAKSSQRLDKYLSSILDQSRNQIEQLIKKGAVKVNLKPVKKGGVVLKAGDKIEIDFPKIEPSRQKEVNFDVEKIYEDEDILVINKPSSIVVHPASSVKEATLVDWLKKENINLSTISGEQRHGIVHRLDKDTTGVMVVAKNNRSHAILSEQLQDRSMGRYYLAIIEPPLKEDLIVEKPIARNPKNRLKMGIVNGGRYAKSFFKKLALSKNEKEELIGAKLFTGRTHQIRVHLNSINRYILGDSLYGFKRQGGKINRLYLHAYILYLIHPTSGKKMEFIAPLPEDMKEYLSKHFNQELVDEKIEPNNFIRLFDNINRMHYPANS